MTEGRAPYARCAAGTTVMAACVGLVDDLHDRWALPSAYLLVDGRLRCQASRGYFQVSDGFSPTTGVIGRVVSSGSGEVVQDVQDDPSFVAAVPGLRAEVCMPVRVFGAVVGAVNLESRTRLGVEAVADVERAAEFLGRRLEALGGLPQPSIAERLARIAVSLAGQRDAEQVRTCAVRGAQEISGMSSAALADLSGQRWRVTHARGPLSEVLGGWDEQVLGVLSEWVQAKTSSYFPPGEEVPPGYEFLARQIRALSVQPLVVAGRVGGLLISADEQPAAHDPALTAAMELLATQTAAMLAVTRTLHELSQAAVRDPLTGLRNRRGLLEHLDAAAVTGDAALVLMDLDGFKAVNDRLGHAEGDAVLRSVARRLTEATQDTDVVFRLGGDEFAVVASGIGGVRDAAALGHRLVAAATRPDRSGTVPWTGASAGVRLLTGEPPSGALVDADVALYAAKAAGRGRAVVWEPALRQEELEQEALLEELRLALRDDALTLVYQPVVDLRSRRVRGLEGLARWHHPVRGRVPPSVFVEGAEQAGVVRSLTRWVLRTAFTEAAGWPAAGDGDQLKIAVNLSATQLADELVVGDVSDALARTGLAADRVVLEVTETAPLADLARATVTLEALALLGVTLALDDFGTGYSSLTHVQALPFDILKVDHTFVAAAAAGEPRATATIAAISTLARRLHVDVVAEGVESLDQLAALADLGCDYAQGVGLARPLTTDQLVPGLELHARGSWTLG